MGATISEFIRSAITSCIVKQHLNTEHLRHILQLTGMTNNLNKLAKKANLYGYAMAEQENEIITKQIENVINPLKMMAKIVQGISFGGVTNYVLNRKEAEVIATCSIRNTNKEAMINSFEIQVRLNHM